MRIQTFAQARRILRWDQIDKHPSTKAAVKAYVDMSTPLHRQEAEHCVNYQLAAKPLADLTAWVARMPKPRQRRRK